jgi:hypothetical protein
MKTEAEIREQIIEVNYYMIEAFRRDDKEGVLKYKLLLDNLVKLYLKD